MSENQGDGGEPKSGGTVSFAPYNGISSLDPADRQDGGAIGGTEMAAIYDLLMRFDTEAGQYVPQPAQSLSANAENTVWTLKLRGGATFSDGIPVDSASVLWSIDHYLQKKGTYSQVWKSAVREMNSPDASTVVDGYGHFCSYRRGPVHRREICVPGRTCPRGMPDVLGWYAVPGEASIFGNRQ